MNDLDDGCNARKTPGPPGELPDELLTRAGLTGAGASFHHAQDGDEYALLRAGPDRLYHHVLKLAGKTAVIVSTSISGGDPTRLLAGHLDGSFQAHADRFFTALDRRIAAIRPAVAIPLGEAGYEVVHTGGGCLAWMRLLAAETDSHILITSDADVDGDPDAAEWIVGRYDENDFVCLDEGFTLAEAIRVADLLPAPNPTGHGFVQETFPNLAAALEALSPRSPPAA